MLIGYLLVERCHLGSETPRVFNVWVGVETTELPEPSTTGHGAADLLIVDTKRYEV